MFLEAGLLIDDGAVCYRHLPADRTGGSLPDSELLYQLLKIHTEPLPKTLDPLDPAAFTHDTGFAHTHPGVGLPSPSRTDLSTMYALENGLGRLLRWWILSADRTLELRRTGWPSDGPARFTYGSWPPDGPARFTYRSATYEGVVVPDPSWASLLRAESDV